MKKIIKEIKSEGVFQVTIADERWYVKTVLDEKSNPSYVYMPSVTWIAGYYPKGIAFYKWLSEKSWSEAEAVKAAAGDKGSKVHAAIEDLIKGEEISMTSKYLNNTTEQQEELTIDEWECIVSFKNWHEEFRPVILKSEQVVFNEKEKYAGTVDFIYKFQDEKYIVDIKTSQNVWPEHELQLSAYKHCFDTVDYNIAILQVGYRKNKKGYKFTVIDDKYDLFLAAKKMWSEENSKVEPKKIELPIKIKLDVKQGVEK
jgi:hypothetical protein